jgi:hypothetical protein
MLAKADESAKDRARELWQEAKELHLIFAAIWRKGPAAARASVGHSSL